MYSRSLASLTGGDGGAGPFATGDVAWVHRIWQVPLWALDDDDLLLLVGRGKGMPHVAALALDRLTEAPLRGGRAGPGALLLAVAALDDRVFSEDVALAPTLARCAADARRLLEDAAVGAEGVALPADRREELLEECQLAEARAASLAASLVGARADRARLDDTRPRSSAG